MRLQADFGLTKFRVGVRVAPRSTPPDGVTTAGSVLHVQHAGEGTPGESDFDCTTVGPPDADGVTYCLGQVLVDPADSLVVTQVSAPEGLEVDPAQRSADPVSCDNGGFCTGPDVIFDDRATDAPVAVDDDFDVEGGGSSDLDLVADDELHGRDVVDLTTTAPAHGTVTAPDPATGSVRYVPDDGYVGTDTFTYTVVTSAGSATATVTVEVQAAPAPSASAPTTTDGDGTGGTGGTGTDGSSGGGTTLAATGAPSGGGGLGALGVVLSVAGAVLLRRRRPRGTHV